MKMMQAWRSGFPIPFLKGFGQVMLQNNPWTGLLFLTGVFLNSLIMGIAAIVAVISGTLTARILKYDQKETDTGLYGFSAALVGIALVFYFKPVTAIWIAIIIGSILATVVQHAFIVKKIPAYTFPFIVVTWAALFIFQYLFPLSGSRHVEAGMLIKTDFAFPFKGFSQVMFIEKDFSGLLFFIAVFISSPVAALYALLASLLGGNLAEVLNMPSREITSGLFSFNAVLCAIVFAGHKRTSGLFVLISVVFAVLIQIEMAHFKLPALTFPFVLATWITQSIIYFTSR